MVVGTKDNRACKEELTRTFQICPKVGGTYILREAHDSGYYYPTKEDGTILIEPTNGKWLKQYYA